MEDSIGAHVFVFVYCCRVDRVQMLQWLVGCRKNNFWARVYVYMYFVNLQLNVEIREKRGNADH